MAKEADKYLVQVDAYGNWTWGKYRQVTKKELDELINKYQRKLMSLCCCGQRGAMTMLAYFKNISNDDSYTDIANAYTLMSGDSQSLVSREHEFRDVLKQYQELQHIRHYGSLAGYYHSKYVEAKKHFEECSGFECSIKEG